ncbi:MAG: ComF family protein [Ktedonobacteraceae bacterium]|nr:ComF family protein [Ktedonobacteraceae bacterium]
MHYLQKYAQHALDIVFPLRCAGCQANGYILCPVCKTTIRPLTPPLCWHCSHTLSVNGSCQSCHQHFLQLSGLRALGPYQEPLRSYIHQLKYDGNTHLAQPLGQLLALAYRTYGMHADIILPVPLHEQRQRERGYNHAALLARVCASLLGITVREDVLLRRRATSAQVGLKVDERYQNVATAFDCSHAAATNILTARCILVIDDVCTTGATLEACAAPLFAAGALSVWGLVLALT